MTFDDAQKEMSFAYYGGATGVFVSGVVWCLAGTTALFSSAQTSMLVLFLGGMLIHPGAIFLSKILKRSGAHQPQNPLGKLALESTAILFVGLFLAFYIAKLQADLFYPIMLLVIGVRYLVFNTLYGSKTYWILGVLLMLSGIACMLLGSSFYTGAVVGGITEIVFSVIIFNQAKSLFPTPLA
jgi:hypothetical protein